MSVLDKQLNEVEPATGPPPDTVRLDLKAERVQEDLVAHEEEAGYKAERVHERLKRLRGWSLVLRGTAIGRVRELTSIHSAADFAGFVLRQAAREEQKVRISLIGSRVILTVYAPAPGGVPIGITDNQLDFAALVG